MARLGTVLASPAAVTGKPDSTIVGTAIGRIARIARTNLSWGPARWALLPFQSTTRVWRRRRVVPPSRGEAKLHDSWNCDWADYADCADNFGGPAGALSCSSKENSSAQSVQSAKSAFPKTVEPIRAGTR